MGFRKIQLRRHASTVSRRTGRAIVGDRRGLRHASQINSVQKSGTLTRCMESLGFL